MPRVARKPKAAAPLPASAAAPTPPAAVEGQDSHSLLFHATGTDSRPLQNALLSDVIAALGIPPENEAHAKRGSAAMALMSAFEPRDAVEAMLAGQAVALNAAGMTALRRAASPNLPPEIGSRLRRDAASLFRTVNETVETIEARRGGGARQRIVVEHISQAIIGAPPKDRGS